MIAGVAVWYGVVQPKATAVLAGPPLLSVAIMPFTSASASADDGHIAERITQDLTSASERSLRSGRVISHGLVAKYQGNAVDPRDVGRDLNVRYLVEGEVRNENGETAVMARLLETTNGTSVWSIRLGPASAGRVSGDLAPQLSNGVRAALYDAEQKRVARLPVASANAMEVVLQAGRLLDQDPSSKGQLAARKLLEEALHRDQGCVPALLGLVWLTEQQMLEHPGHDQEELVQQMDDLTKRAVALDRDDPRVWRWRSDALLAKGQWDGALEANATALRIDPYNDRIVGDQGFLLLVTGRPEEALPVLDRAIALDPRSDEVGRFLEQKCSANLNLGRYEAAIAFCERSLALEDWWMTYVVLLGAYGQKEDKVRVEAVKRELLKRQPEITIARLKAPQLWGNPAYQQQREAHLYAGLRKAGIPEN
jgi:adenylate cyclase